MTEPARQYTVESLNTSEDERLRQVLDHFAENRAYASLPAERRTAATLATMRERYHDYRRDWRLRPESIIAQAAAGVMPVSLPPPLCVDIEVAAICDLACPFCYRQHIATADGLIRSDLYKKIVDECVELGVPSLKLNWRGEPLMHPNLPEFVAYAKDRGILEVLINTNAVGLTSEKSEALIRAGVDVVIFSFDGGRKETYEAMRPGRFRENSFAEVYGNIKAFAETRKRLGRFFPRTRIQMIVTERTVAEVDDFLRLFAGVVDDVSTKAYSERGGDLREAATGRVAVGRLPCQQLFQRLIVTYDGRVHMCCYDWEGSEILGYLDEDAFTRGDRDIDAVMAASREGRRGYERLRELAAPKRRYLPARKVNTIREIWQSFHLNRIRRTHLEKRVDDIVLCRSCNFRDTYAWETIATKGNRP